MKTLPFVFSKFVFIFIKLNLTHALHFNFFGTLYQQTLKKKIMFLL